MPDYGNEKPYQPPQAEKRENESRTYKLLWAVELNGDTISASSWRSEDFIILSDSFTPSYASVFIAGGLRGSVGEVTNTITTVSGRIYEQSLAIKVADVRVDPVTVIEDGDNLLLESGGNFLLETGDLLLLEA